MQVQEKTVQASTPKPKEKLWTWNFFLLWQGQLVSAVGDRLYAIALGFWILAVTHSTALMATLLAVSTIPRVIISPFAGVIVDRSDRRNMLVWMDLIRGLAVVFVGIATLFGFIQIWMVFMAGIIIGICGAFFDPAVRSAIPDISPKSEVMRANSVFNMMRQGTNIVGNSAGGFVFQVLGAPLMFLANGISYILSAFTELFIKIPPIEKPKQQTNFWADMKEGFVFIWKFRGLRYLLLIASVINFAGNIAVILFLPFFQKSADLGPAKYGIAMAFLTAGMFLGMFFTSTFKIPPRQRLFLFLFSNLIASLSYAIFPFSNYYLILALFLIGGFFNSILNVFITSSVQLTVPAHMRGKVFAMMFTLFQGLSPIAMGLGGILAEFLSIKWVICVSFAFVLALNIPYAFMPSFKRFINFDPDKDKLEEVL